jgi:hypothetical protein
MQVEETTPSTPFRPTRAGFVRSLPLTMPVEEVIERGREIGIELQTSDIHAARYYMRQQEAGAASSIPQQLMLGGTFVTKREPRAGAKGNGAAAKANGTNGSSHATQNGAAESTDKLAQADGTNGIKKLRDPDYEDDDFSETPRASFAEVVAPTTHTTQKAKGRGKAVSKAEAKAAAKVVPATKQDPKANGLHSRLQARLSNATFRETAREGRETVSAREVKATVGKALLLDLDTALKPRSKRAVQSAEAQGVKEEQLRLIALRIGTQRAREILDAMEELAARA